MGLYYKEEWLEEFLDSKGVFYTGNESDNDENNEQQQLLEGFANRCYKIVSPILQQEQINDCAVCKHYSGTLLLVENVTRFWKLELHISKRNHTF